MRTPRYAVLAAVVLAAACATWKWSGTRASGGRAPTAALRGVAAEEANHPPPTVDASAEDAAALHLSTAPRAALPVRVPKAPSERERTALFYSDVGPDTVDVSAYPAQERYNYSIYARDCAACHTLARSINAPLISRGWWEFYMLGMRVRSRRQGRPLPPAETKAILDFLEYDSRVRKVEHAREFDALTEELKARFDASIAERLRTLQKRSPRLLPNGER